ncbi:hypothetical protein AAVH_12086 [Aphelenchoides avenae]|nr:hypothetical protein AAVH_12086 [Aphelenchus avenae]
MTSAQAFFDLSQGPHSSNHSETSSEESDLDEQPNEKRRRGPGLRFKLLKFFRTLEEYKNWWNTEKEKAKWVSHSAHQNKNHLVEKCPDEPFVLGYEVESPDKIFVVWTTMKLLERQLSADHLQVDATSAQLA